MNRSVEISDRLKAPTFLDLLCFTSAADFLTSRAIHFAVHAILAKVVANCHVVLMGQFLNHYYGTHLQDYWLVRA